MAAWQQGTLCGDRCRMGRKANKSQPEERLKPKGAHAEVNAEIEITEGLCFHWTHRNESPAFHALWFLPRRLTLTFLEQWLSPISWAEKVWYEL